MNTFFKTTIGVGQIVGLIFGTFLFMIGGFTLPFVAYGFLNILISPLVLLIPSNLESYNTSLTVVKEPRIFELSSEIEIEKQNEKPKEKQNRISDLSDPIDIENLKTTSSMLSLLTHRKILKYLAFAVFDMSILNFSPAILTQRLKELGIPNNMIAFYFAIPFLFPVFSAAIYMRF